MTRCDQPEFVDFYLPFGGKLASDNRWVKLAGLVPWEVVERRYSGMMAQSGMGAPPLPSRVAFGAMIIKERLGVSDEETVEQIRENPYLQYFLGYHELLQDAPFDPSMMVHFRSRFAQEDYDEINPEIIRKATEQNDRTENETENESEDGSDSETEAEESEGLAKSGKLLIDATVTPADITYPTDLKLLNAAREKLEHLIDLLHRRLVGRGKKPRTYRRKARRDFLAIVKLKRAGAKKVRKAIGKQLRYVRRDLGHIDALLKAGADLHDLKDYDYRCLLVAHEIYRQQLEMWQEKKHRIKDRIVRLSQPWVRPMVRGKASAKVEFGAKDLSRGVGWLYDPAPVELGRLQRMRRPPRASGVLPGAARALPEIRPRRPDLPHPSQSQLVQAAGHSALGAAAWKAPQADRAERGGVGGGESTGSPGRD